MAAEESFNILELSTLLVFNTESVKKKKNCCFQASNAKYTISTLFWKIKQHISGNSLLTFGDNLPVQSTI